MIDAHVHLWEKQRGKVNGLPVYDIGGDQDPVGSWGEGVYHTSNLLAATGHTVITKLYSGYRHEIHNYDDIKRDVEKGIIDFFNGCLEK